MAAFLCRVATRAEPQGGEALLRRITPTTARSRRTVTVLVALLRAGHRSCSRRSLHQLVPFNDREHVATLQLPCADSGAQQQPALVLLGGTAQTINGWVGHHKQLAAGRALLQYDLRGQGRATTLSIVDCSLRRHVADFEELVLRRLKLPTPCDLVS